MNDFLEDIGRVKNHLATCTVAEEQWRAIQPVSQPRALPKLWVD